MTLFTASMTTEASMTPDRDLDRPLYSITIRWTWPGGAWTHFSLVRRMNSPAHRREEGSVVLETRPEKWGDPVFEDQGAPPDRWVYYTAFVLNMNRVWEEAGYSYEMGTGDHDWTLNLPELLPGVSISDEKQVVAKADPGHELVEFLQGPGLVYDRVISYGETVQLAWDPLTAPPNMLPALLGTLGFAANETLTDDRLREVAYALLVERPQGSLRSIQTYAEGVTGVNVFVQESHNKMISTLDSSFEGVVRTDPTILESTYQDMLDLGPDYETVRAGYFNYRDVLIETMPGANSLDLIEKSHWTPQNPSMLQLRRYEYYPDPSPAIPTEALDTFFLHFLTAGRIACGETDLMVGAVPVSWWTNLRGGVFARGAGTTLTMSIDLYGFNGELLRTIFPFGATALTADWTWYHTPDEMIISVNKTVDNILGDPEVWSAEWDRKAQPQVVPTLVGTSLVFEWNTDPDPSGLIADQPLIASQARVISLIGLSELQYVLTMAGQNPSVPQTPWRLAIRWDIGAAKNTYIYHTPPATTALSQYDQFPLQYDSYEDITNFVPTDRKYQEHLSGWIPASDQVTSADLEWKLPPGVTDAWFGIDVQCPALVSNTYERLRSEDDYQDVKSTFADFQEIRDQTIGGGWSVPSMHTAIGMEIRSGTTGRAYWAVPVIEVSGEADIDLVVVDDV